MMIEVRCCCQPKKLLGWLPVMDDVRDGDIISFAVMRALKPFPSAVVPVRSEAYTIELPVAVFAEIGPGVSVRNLALKSEETPIERLRLISGFRESSESNA